MLPYIQTKVHMLNVCSLFVFLFFCFKYASFACLLSWCWSDLLKFQNLRFCHLCGQICRNIDFVILVLLKSLEITKLLILVVVSVQVRSLELSHRFAVLVLFRYFEIPKSQV